MSVSRIEDKITSPLHLFCDWQDVTSILCRCSPDFCNGKKCRYRQNKLLKKCQYAWLSKLRIIFSNGRSPFQLTSFGTIEIFLKGPCVIPSIKTWNLSDASPLITTSVTIVFLFGGSLIKSMKFCVPFVLFKSGGFVVIFLEDKEPHR